MSKVKLKELKQYRQKHVARMYNGQKNDRRKEFIYREWTGNEPEMDWRWDRKIVTKM